MADHAEEGKRKRKRVDTVDTCILPCIGKIGGETAVPILAH